MSLKKTAAIAVAAGALAAISVPAMAFENEFHGSYTFNTIFSNFQNGAASDFNPASIYALNPDGTVKTLTYGNKRKTNNYFEQRARLQYTAKANDDLKLVTQFEINNRFGAKNSGANTIGTGQKGGGIDFGGNDLDTDGTNFLTKHVYLDFNLGQHFNAKTGLQPYKDNLKGVFVDADLPAVMTTTKLGDYSLVLGFSRFGDDSQGGLNRVGDNNKDLFIMDNTFAINKDTKVGFSYYFLADYAGNPTGGAGTTILNNHTAQQDIQLHTFGLNGETKIGALGLSGFAAMQLGNQKGGVNSDTTNGPVSKRQFHGWAASVAAKLPVGPGTAKTAFLFTSGNNSSKESSYKGWVSTGVNSWNDGGLMIMARSTANSPTTTDDYLRKTVTNVAIATLGYDAKLTDKLYANGNVGFGFAPSSKTDVFGMNPTATGSNNGCDFLGTEINLETGYKVYRNLTLRAQAAYMVLGGYYKNATLNSAGNAADPENPYTGRLLASFAF